MLEEIYNQYRGILARQEVFGCKPMKLTKKERFIVAFVNGVRTQWEYNEGSSFVTTEPCGISWDGHKFIVVVRRGAA